MSDNGKLADSELTWVAGVQLALKTARAFVAMSVACYAATGRWLTIELPAGGYRSFWTQGDMRTRVDRWTFYNLSRISLIPLAKPGTSKHGEGLCIDIADWSTVGTWVLANMARFGFSRPFSIRDRNHLLYDGHTVPASIVPASTVPASTGPVKVITPAPPTQEELDEMAATKTASVVRDYETEGVSGKVRTALIYPNGDAVCLNNTQDVEAITVAHVMVFGIPATNEKATATPLRWPVQLSARQWNAFWAAYPGKKIGF